MNAQLQTQATEHAKSSFIPVPGSLLQRKCARGNHTLVAGECEKCSKKKMVRLQTKVEVNEPGDSLNQRRRKSKIETGMMP